MGNPHAHTEAQQSGDGESLGSDCGEAVKDYVGLARGYEDGVRDGSIVPESGSGWPVTGRPGPSRARSQDFPYWFDEQAASAICRMAEMLPHIKGPKAKVIGQDDDGDSSGIRLCRAVAVSGVTTIKGSKRVWSPLRRFRVGMPLIPRKNAKSTIAAIVLLFMLTADGESGAECVSAATTRDQANIAAETAWRWSPLAGVL